MRQKDARNIAKRAGSPAWEPPAYLHADGQAVWREVVLSVSPGHFAASDASTLALFCQFEAENRALLVALAKLPIVPRTDAQRERSAFAQQRLDAIAPRLLSFARALRLIPSARTRTDRNDHSLPPPMRSEQPGDDLLCPL